MFVRVKVWEVKVGESKIGSVFFMTESELKEISC